jgi:hypothetical protein
LLAGGVTLAAVWAQVHRGWFPVGSGVYTMGAPLWWRDLGWPDARSAWPGVGLLVGAASLLAWSRVTTGLAGQAEPKERLLAAMGAVVTLACFLAGVNFAYRWIFVLWPAFWLWRQAQAPALPGPRRRVAALACALIALALWQDGLFCAAINSLPPRSPGWIDHAQLVFRLWTQPLQWLLMALFAGWLLEAVQVILREWWQQRAQA